MLKVENISTGYGKKQVLFDVSFEIKNGEIVLLAGSNGSGKSTLLKALFGLLPIWNEGRIFFEGENIVGNPSSSLLKKGLLYVPQKNNLFEDLSVKENLEMAGLTIIDKKIKQQRIEKALSIFDVLTPILNKAPMRLSGGQRQLLTLAMAILHEPKMILLDEPFTGLSPQNITFVTDNLKILNKSGITFLIVEHRIRECLEIANRVIGLKLGRILSEIEVNQNLESTN